MTKKTTFYLPLANIRFAPKLIEITWFSIYQELTVQELSSQEKGKKCLDNNLIYILMEFIKMKCQEMASSMCIKITLGTFKKYGCLALCFIRLLRGRAVGMLLSTCRWILCQPICIWPKWSLHLIFMWYNTWRNS